MLHLKEIYPSTVSMLKTLTGDRGICGRLYVFILDLKIERDDEEVTVRGRPFHNQRLLPRRKSSAQFTGGSGSP